MRAPPAIAALEIGTTKTRVLIAEIREDGHLTVVGVGEARSEGVRKGQIVALDAAANGVRAAVQAAEDQSGRPVDVCYLALSGGHIRGEVNRGTVHIMNEERLVRQKEMEDVAAAARRMNLPSGRETLHSIGQHYYVDGQEGVVNPEGMEGSRIELDMLIVHGDGAPMRNTVRAARMASLEVEDVAFSGLCAALAVLTPEQKASGALVLNLGGGMTDYLVYANQMVAAAGAVAVGGDHVTNDIALGLKIPTAQAERLKIEHGAAEIEPARRHEAIPLPAESGFPGRNVRLGDLHLIAHARLQELLKIIRRDLERRGVLIRLGAGVVLTGGGALLRRLPELVSREYNLPCVIGKPIGVSGLGVASGAEYATAVGLLRYAAMNGGRSASGARWSDFLRRLFGS